MNNRYFKMFVCVLMVCCLLFSFTFTAHATFPGEVGEFGGAIASIIAGAMGIDFDYREMSIQSINQLLGIVDELNEKIWVMKIGAGMTALGIAKEGYDTLSQYIKDLIVNENIQSNSSGSIWSGDGKEWNGYEFNLYGYTYRTEIFETATWNRTAGYSVTLHTPEGQLDIEALSGNNRKVVAYYNGNIVGEVPTGSSWLNGALLGSTYSISALDEPQISIFIYQSGNWNPSVRFSIPNETITTISKDWSYRAGTIDTTVGDNLPATGGMIINFPNTETGSIDEILANLSQQVLSNETDNITTEFVNDIGEPVVTDQTIADTPWTDLAGTLDQIKAFLQSTNISIQGHISSALDSIVDGVDAITEDVALGTSTTVKAYIDNFIELYLPWIQEIGSHGSIWNYVVSWIGSISSCFSWSLSALSSCGATFLAPIYAAFAGAVVIAIYRRFGR